MLSEQFQMNIPNTGEAAQQLRAAMESEDENESNRDDEELIHFNAVRKIYIKDETRAGNQDFTD